MDKRLIFPGNTEERRDVWFVREDRQYLRKHASGYHPEIQKYIEGAKPLDNLVQVLLTALGAYEFWGQNVNGDRFREGPLSHKGADYGYETFGTNANYFLHHVNKDPALAKGKVLKAVWNDKAKRVELIVGIDANLDPEGVAMIDRGEDLAVSMGAKVPYDVCSICGNRAKTRAEYCDHLRYMMNQIDPISNLLVGADNTLPRFFDISRVLIPADKTAHMWTKVAGAANPYRTLGSAELAELPPGKIADLSYLHKVAEERKEAGREKLGRATKTAVAVKAAEITKRIEATMAPDFANKLDTVVPTSKAMLQETAPSLKPEVIEQMCKAKIALEQVLASFAALGMEPKRDEMRELIIHYQPQIDAVGKMGLDTISPEALAHLAPLAAERSFFRPILVRRIVKLAADLEAGRLQKEAQAVNQLLSHPDKPVVMGSGKKSESIHPGYIVGLLAALYAMFGSHASGAARGIGRLIADYPLAAIPLGAGAIAGARALFHEDPRPTGFYDVDANLSGLYNKNWQSRFADAQARPVAVIKTGAAKADTALAKKLFYGVPAIYLGSKVLQAKEDLHPEQRPGHVSNFVANNPEILSVGLIGEHLSGRPISSRVAKAIESGKRIIKSASIQDIEFLEAAPSTERELLWDIAILDAATRIHNLLGG